MVSSKSLQNQEAKMSKTTVAADIRLKRVSPEYWQVTFDLPPLNIFGPANIPQLEEVVSLIETDERVKVVVFDSAIDGFFLIHYDFLAKPEESAKFPLGRTGLQALPDMLVRISRAPVVSIALIRGRATGVGSELALACDMRFASREKALLSQWEVGAGLVPGGGPMARLPRLLGRGIPDKFRPAKPNEVVPNPCRSSGCYLALVCLILAVAGCGSGERSGSSPDVGGQAGAAFRRPTTGRGRVLGAGQSACPARVCRGVR